jgi:caffeoyl-CoA O-methyltransferase
VIVDPVIDQYATEHADPEPPHLAALAQRTREELGPRAGMMVGRQEGALLSMLVAITGARRVLEIGTFTGYSALWMAGALPPDGRIVTCDVSERHAEIARAAFAASEHADKIDFRFGPAIDTIATLDGPFDLVFIDADKSSYAAYYEACLPKLSERGFLVIDNVLWRGEVLASSSDDADTAALIALNDMIRDDPRVRRVLLPVRDGVTLVRRA